MFPDTVAPQFRSVTGPATILPTQPSKPTLAINIRRSPLCGTPILTFLRIPLLRLTFLPKPHMAILPLYQPVNIKQIDKSLSSRSRIDPARSCSLRLPVEIEASILLTGEESAWVHDVDPERV